MAIGDAGICWISVTETKEELAEVKCSAAAIFLAQCICQIYLWGKADLNDGGVEEIMPRQRIDGLPGMLEKLTERRALRRQQRARTATLSAEQARLRALGCGRAPGWHDFRKPAADAGAENLNSQCLTWPSVSLGCPE